MRLPCEAGKSPWNAPSRFRSGTALDLLCRAADIQYNAGMPMGGFGPEGSRKPTLNLFQSTSATHQAPSFASGPFRLNLTGIQFHRERNFTTQANGPVPFPGAMPAGPFASNEQFFASLQILAEPRLNVAMNGSIKLVEAIDDQGQSLLSSSSASGNFRHNAGYNRFDNAVGTSLTTQIQLRYPDQPARRIRTLRGRVPLIVSSRKDEPLVIALDANSRGKSFKSGEITLTVVEIKTEPAGGQTMIDLNLQSMASSANPGGIAPEFLIAQMLRTPGNSQNQIEIVDAHFHPLFNWYVSSQNFSPEGLRLTIQFLPERPVLFRRSFDTTNSPKP